MLDVLEARPALSPGLASQFLPPKKGYGKNVIFELAKTWQEARTPIVLNLYALLTLCVGVIGLAMLVI